MAIKPPFKSLLIANRGEIAVRIARTARAMGMRTIAIYSELDAAALHVRACDVAVPIGGAAARDSYLRADKIVAAARSSGAQALHPGYGFLSENAAFAQSCIDAGLVFVGPSPRAMQAMGDKIAAKKAVAAVGVPVVPGFSERSQSAQRLEEEARRIGVPLLVKAAAGGGGRGMRLVTDLGELSDALASAQREAQSAFGDGTVFLERYISRPRHVEVQIIADQHGNYVALGERECSIQRRYQKIVEESPSPAVDAELRAQLQQAAIDAARSVQYSNAGTVEFVLDPEGRFYFLEMNARLQVEHPVTEAVTGVDLVREQLNVAAGATLALDPGSTAARGHAVEVRVYAEDPANDHLPSSGTVTLFSPPQGPGIRNDVAVEEGSVVSSAYDSMLGKLIVYDRTRADCLQRLRSALEDYAVGGLATNLPLLRAIVAHPAFARGETTTDFLERHFAQRPAPPPHEAEPRLAAAGALQYLGLGQAVGAWRHAAAIRSVRFAGDDSPIEVRKDYEQRGWRCTSGRHSALVEGLQPGLFLYRTPKDARKYAAWVTTGGVALSWHDGVHRFELPAPPESAQHGAQRGATAGSAGVVSAPMSGTIVKVLAHENDQVDALQVVVVMEAMKMEHSIVTPYAGVVAQLHVKEGDSVAAGDLVARIREA
ncbi:MAG: biotin/lipoyl-binding protein [Candidatus Eremiobacteraeota bacterium]|nr:biotin/lipoyl-binding protein [Candidatus Eremiobacteraeota bacterium]